MVFPSTTEKYDINLAVAGKTLRQPSRATKTFGKMSGCPFCRICKWSPQTEAATQLARTATKDAQPETTGPDTDMSFFSNCLRKLQTADIGFQVNPGDTGDNGLFVG
jgi:hypothetical protein